MSPADPIAGLLEQRAAGRPRGLYSVCSSNPLVLEAAVQRAARSGLPVLVEATANQVNQHGGYTGMTPERFASDLAARCRARGADPELVLFGGDHLGPYPWRRLPAAEAMSEAAILVRRFVAAGARKIHLDASMPLGGDTCPALEQELAVQRAALLCQAAEEEHRARLGAHPDAPAPWYVIGTEVPAPGGTRGEEEQGPVPTRPEDFRAVVDMHRSRFLACGLDEAWTRVVGVVVQPGVEFDATRVHPYRRERAEGLVRALSAYSRLFFEGHSTDYQTDEELRALVEDGVAVLKVGPALTFALREALFGLCFVGRELSGGKRPSDLVDTLIGEMRADPVHWKAYYPDGGSLPLLLAYGLSDRARYYWGRPAVQASVRNLFDELRRCRPPPELLSQFVPRLGGVHRIARLPPDPECLAIAAVDDELARYERACFPDPAPRHPGAIR